MESTRLSSKGQVIIPKSIREAKHWEAGTEFVIEETDEGILLKPKSAKLFPTTDPNQGLGCAGYDGPVLSPEEIDKALLQDLRTSWNKP